MKRALAIGSLIIVTVVVGVLIRAANRSHTAVASIALSTVLADDASTSFVFEPALIRFGTGLAFGHLLGGAYGSHIRWVDYSVDSARAIGTIDTNDCIPACSVGQWAAQPASVTLTRSVHSRFTRMVLAWAGHRQQMRLVPFAQTWTWQ